MTTEKDLATTMVDFYIFWIFLKKYELKIQKSFESWSCHEAVKSKKKVKSLKITITIRGENNNGMNCD